VFGQPEMSKDFRVDNQGRIRPVFIKEDLTVACMTELQVARMLEEKYSKYLRTPMVDVFVKDFQSQPVAVIGAVMQPGQFKLQRRIRLLELLSRAGGANASSGTTINLIRSQEYNYCRTPAGTVSPPDKAVDKAVDGAKGTDEVFAGQLITLNLRDVLLGTPETNIYVEPGDTVSVPDADQVFLVGGIMRPGAIPMKQALRLSEAIGMAGGFFTDVAKNKIRVSRQIAGSTQRETLTIDFDAIEKKKAEDLILRASDVIEVPSSAMKGIGRSLLGLIAPTAGQLPLRVIRPY
jgi:polysaccharide biosynthesis/export protein